MTGNPQNTKCNSQSYRWWGDKAVSLLCNIWLDRSPNPCALGLNRIWLVTVVCFQLKGETKITFVFYIPTRKDLNKNSSTWIWLSELVLWLKVVDSHMPCLEMAALEFIYNNKAIKEKRIHSILFTANKSSCIFLGSDFMYRYFKYSHTCVFGWCALKKNSVKVDVTYLWLV